MTANFGSGIDQHFSQEVEEKRDKLNNKIKNLYGPITGNRILHESAIRAIEKHHSKPVRDVLKDICERKDAEELENWRGFYSKVSTSRRFTWKCCILDCVLEFQQSLHRKILRKL